MGGAYKTPKSPSVFGMLIDRDVRLIGFSSNGVVTSLNYIIYPFHLVSLQPLLKLQLSL